MDDLINDRSLKCEPLRNWWIRRKFLYYLKIAGFIWFDGNLPGNNEEINKLVYYPGFNPIMFPGALLEIKKLNIYLITYMIDLLKF